MRHAKVSGVLLLPLLVGCSSTTIINSAPEAGAVAAPPAEEEDPTAADASTPRTACTMEPDGPLVTKSGACSQCFVTKCASECSACSADLGCSKAAACVSACALDADCVHDCVVGLSTASKQKLDAATETCARKSCGAQCFPKEGIGDVCAGDDDCISPSYCLINPYAPKPALGWCTAHCTTNEDCAANATMITGRFGKLAYCGSGVCFIGCSTNDDCKPYSRTSCGAGTSFPKVCGSDT